jgi:FRG domain
MSLVMTWEDAEQAWTGLLRSIEEAQFKLNCTWVNAWFRGEEDSKFELLPTLLRRTWINIPDVERPSPQAGAIDPNYVKVSRRRQALRKQLQDAHRNQHANLSSLRKEYERLKHEERKLKEAANAARTYRPLLRLGERDAFISYHYRAGLTWEDSWSSLAYMQHHGVPTRLLDWTDTLATALYFATKLYRMQVEKFWFDDRKANPMKSRPIIFPPSHIIDTLPTPVIWILNPYHLSKYGDSKRNRVWDLSLDGELDYYRCFIEQKSWPFSSPIPAYSPWRSDRMAAQQAMFIVWGYDRRPLDQIVDDGRRSSGTILAKIQLSKLAAVYAVKHLRQMLGFDRFAIFRDLDALGAKVRREFLHDANDPKEKFD